MSMIYKPLGQTGLNVSIIGFGAATLGNGYGMIEDATGTRAVHAAIDHGINYFDTSPFYGDTLSETRLGNALVGHRDNIILATKGGHYGNGFDFSASRLERSVEESLRRLKTDVIDVYQLHDIEYAHLHQIVNEALPTLMKLRTKGLIRFIGITGYPVHMLQEVAMQSHVDTILSYCHYNLMSTTLIESLLPFAANEGIGLINASALHMGVLTEQGAPDWHPAPPHVHAAAQQAAQLAHEHGDCITRVALQFVLQQPHIATTLVGMRTEAEVLENVLLVGTLPDAALLAEIQALLAPVQNIMWQVGRPENYEPGALPLKS
jgi:L-galactose dehydrogenase